MNQELADRRQRAVEAYHDAPGGHATYPETRLGLAIETATRVRVDDALVQAARPGTTPGSVVWKRTRGRLVRAFEAAGFEVEL